MIRTPTLALAVVAVLLTACLCGCAPKTAPGLRVESPRAAWTNFRRNYCVPSGEPGLRVNASLYYTRLKPRRRTNRTLVTLWGDFKGPVRLDVSASIGRILAHIRENGDGLLVFYPSDNKAYTHVNPVLGATRLGMPFPFSLHELARVLTGDFSGLTPGKYLSARRAGDDYVYEVNDGDVTSVTLDGFGRPVLLVGRTARGTIGADTWTLAIDRYGDAPKGAAPLPDKLTLSLDNGEQGVLHIKSREFMLKPWPAKSTDLPLPDGVEPMRLDRGHGATDIPEIHEDR